jgi:hypothetical protein
VSIDAGNLIGYLDRFKPHRVVSSSSLILLEDFLIHGGKEIRVYCSGNVERKVSEVVSRVRFIQGIESNYILV